jgi:hypothetical protein
LDIELSRKASNESKKGDDYTSKEKQEPQLQSVPATREPDAFNTGVPSAVDHILKSDDQQVFHARGRRREAMVI